MRLSDARPFKPKAAARSRTVGVAKGRDALQGDDTKLVCDHVKHIPSICERKEKNNIINQSLKTRLSIEHKLDRGMWTRSLVFYTQRL